MFAIYIPAYNAEKTLPLVFSRITKSTRDKCQEIFVVDNASTDGTAEAVKSQMKQSGWEKLKLIVNPENLGYGGSQKVAYNHCISHGYSTVVMLHGDAQYAPELVDLVAEKVESGIADLSFGSRIAGHPLKGGMPLHRFIGNRVLTSFQNFFLNGKLTEYHSGYRVYSVEALKTVPFDRLSNDFHFDTEILILFMHLKKRIAEVTIPTHYGDEENYVNVWKYGMQVLITTFSFWLHKIGLRKSRNWSRIFGEKLAEECKVQKA